MPKAISIALVVVVVGLIAATSLLTVNYRKTTAAYTELQAEDAATRDRYAEAINEIAAIQDSLNTIAFGDAEAKLQPSQLQAETRMSETESDAAMERISLIKAGIERTKGRIAQLDASLKQRGIQISGLRRMVANLKDNVAEKEAYAATLTSRVDSLTTQVTGLVATVEQNTEQIETQRKALGTVFYVVGTKKDLTTSGVVAAQGGVLGIGKTLKPSGHVNEGVFTAIDTDYETVIRIPATKAQVLSAQPPSSYELQLVGEQMELRIIDPERFRAVKHVVIMTT